MKRMAVLSLCLAFGLAACGRSETQPGTNDITGMMPRLQFTMTRANDGATVSADAYRGKVVLLYFGYTHCPDVCPTTLANLAGTLGLLGPRAKDVRVLFVSVDPERDTLLILKEYVNTFAPQIDGLRGTNNEIAALARRYRVLYGVTRYSSGRNPTVMHSNTIFLFDGTGRARMIALDTGDEKVIKSDIERLLSG